MLESLERQWRIRKSLVVLSVSVGSSVEVQLYMGRVPCKLNHVMLMLKHVGRSGRADTFEKIPSAFSVE